MERGGGGGASHRGNRGRGGGGGRGVGRGGYQSGNWRPATSGGPPPQEEGGGGRRGSGRGGPARGGNHRGRGPAGPSGGPGNYVTVDSLTTPGRGGPTMQALALTEGKASPIRRPDNGGRACIRTLAIRVNHFPVSFNPDGIIRHYDVDVKEHIVAKHARGGKISKVTLAMIRNKMCADDPANFPLSMTAYDGEKNIFSAVALPTGSFEVEFAEGEDTRRRRYTVSIKLVSELRLRKLKDYLQGNLCPVPRDILQGMDVVMKENPTRHMISVGRTFHPVDASPRDFLRCGITSSKGFQHSLKPSVQGLSLCLDYSVLALRKRLPVLNYLQEHIPGFNVNSFRKFRNQVDSALRGLKVTVTHRTTRQKYVINRLTKDDTVNITFDIEDLDGKAPPTKVKLVDYFRGKYNKDIVNKYIPCLDLGKNNRINYVPMEFCVLVEGQVVPKENLDRDSALILKRVSLADARDRRRTICEMVSSQDGPCGRGLVQNFGMEVNSEMTAVEGRVIGPPELKLGGGPSCRTVRVRVDKENCQWNLIGKGVVDGKPIDRWAMLDFSAADNQSRLNVKQFVDKLIERCGKLGIHMEEPYYEPSNMRKFENNDILGQVLESFCDRAREANKGYLQIVVCVMSWKDAGYKYLKWFSETRIGVVTQCCLSINANDVRRRDQYLANLALKMNAKLGGSNVELMERLPYFLGDDHVMFIGADVNHPGSRNMTSPSIAAVVATVNWPAVNRYAARVCPQDNRSEKILNFGHMCWELVETYTRFNNVKPKKIVLFRDGVSEGQFDMVLNEEMLDLKRVFMSYNYHPTITLIVAQKRHQTRLFPENERDGNNKGNVPPGTVVDTMIVHPSEFDFYLCSHYGSLGTSKPTHYHVLWDEHGFTSDQLQKLIYNMCFTFARCTKPVSLVPPVYYADLAAYRGRLYYEAVAGQSPPSASSSSTTLTSSSLSSTPTWDERLYKLHADLQNVMFFV